MVINVIMAMLMCFAVTSKFGFDCIIVKLIGQIYTNYINNDKNE